MTKRSLIFIFLSILIYLFSIESSYSQKIPDRPSPPRLVNDFAGMLKPEEVNSLEQKLDAFSDSTSTQIAIVIVPTLSGYDIDSYAQDLGEKWGIGQKNLNNGVLILIKPKNESDGHVKIAPGYGLEGVIPDLTCSEIIDRELIPAFRIGEYYTGLNNATNVIMSLARGQYSAAQYGNKSSRSSGRQSPLPFIIIVVVIIALISRGGSGRSNNRHIGTGGLPFWMLMGMMNSGRGSGGSWGGFSGGSGGGGGGGFGGFGGGSFGGGGASGSW